MTLVDPPGRQGPGPVAADVVARLDLGIARRAAGPLPGERRAPGVGSGTELAQLRPYEPGRSIEDAKKKYGLSRVVKLASNENPLGPSPDAVEASLGTGPNRLSHPSSPTSGEFGGQAGVVQQARSDRQAILKIVNNLPAAERKLLPDIVATADALLNRAEELLKAGGKLLLRDVTWTAAVGTDKVQLLTGKATERTEIVTLADFLRMNNPPLERINPADMH